MGKKREAPIYETREIKDLKDMLNSSVELFGDRVAYLVKDKPGGVYREITFREFKKDVEAFGTMLLDLGLKDKKIAVIGENRYEWAVTYLSVVNGVGTIVPLDKQLPEAELESLMRRANVSAIVYSDVKKEQIESIAKRVDFVKYYISMDSKQENGYKALLKKGKERIKKGEKKYINAKINNKEVKIILFTSGTTEMSKAVMLTHWNIAYNIKCVAKMVKITENDRFLSVLPIHHTYECTGGFLLPIYRGSSVAYCEGLRHIAKNMQEAKPTMILAVPLLFESMYQKVWDTIRKGGKEKLVKRMIKMSNAFLKVGIDIRKKVFKQVHESLGGNLRLGISGAAAINPDVIKGFRDFGVKMIQGYGLTECAPLAAVNSDVWFNDASCGRAIPGIELKIAEPNQEGIGELVVKGDNVMVGYYQNEEATKKIIIDGWLHTGDLGYQDEDGFFYITGRKKNVLITKNGKNIFPEEIEALLNESEYIKESMVYEADKKKEDDTIVAAHIVPDYEVITQKLGEFEDDKLRDLIWDEIKKVNAKLVSYKHVKSFDIRKEEFEKTTTMKIKRYLAK